MSFRVYIKPFEDDGSYATDWTEVTEDLDATGISAIKQSLDNNEYDVGIFKNSGVTLTLINVAGRYSDAGQPGSLFKFRRSNSLVRITWNLNTHPLICGFFVAGEVALSEDVTVFEGLLDDTALKQDADSQSLQFKVLGKEGIFGEVDVNFADLSAGDTFEEIIYTILNQSEITELLTVAALNIDCDVNVATDVIDSLENKTVLEALRTILAVANSVLYIIDDVIYVSPREESTDVEHTFYGPGANAGMENVIDITDFRMGLNRTFNFITWKDTDLVSQDASSVAAYGIRKKEIDCDLITDNTKRQTIIDAIKDEFKNPKREMILRAPMDHDTVALVVLDKVSVDHPNVGINDSTSLPYWDTAVWDESMFPNEVLPIAIESSARFKLLTRDIDPGNQEMVYYVREI